MRNLAYLTQEELVFYQEGVHFRNLHFFTTYDSDTLLYIFYEANLYGNYDIFLSKYSQDGNITDPEYILGGDGDEINMDVLPWEHIAWQIDGKIKVSEYMGGSNFASPETIDSIDCQYPSIGPGGIVYEKIIDDSSRVYFATWHYISGWDEPDVLCGQGHNKSINFTGPENQPYGSSTILWENFNGTDWTILFGEIDGVEIFYTGIHSDVQLYPKGLFIDIPVLFENAEEPTLLTYCASDNNPLDIFVNKPWEGFLNCNNISNSQAVDFKPNVDIGGQNYGTYYIYDLWERYINGHWQLMASKLSMQVDINENEAPNIRYDISLFPNPFSEQLNIQIHPSIHESITVNIYNPSGMIIRSFYEEKSKQLIWDRNDYSGNTVPAGLYFIEAISGNQCLFKKVIVID